MLVQRKQESFAKDFTFITGYSYNRKLKVKKVEKNVKINWDYHQKYILTPIFKEEILSFCANILPYVKFHQDKAQSHISKSIAPLFEKMGNETRIETIRFQV